MSQWPSANAKTAISHQNNLFVNTGGLYIKCYIYYSLLLLERSKGRICGVTGRSYVSYIYKVSLFFEKSRYINVFWPYSLPQSPFPFHPRLLPKHDLNFTFFLFSIFLKITCWTQWVLPLFIWVWGHPWSRATYKGPHLQGKITFLPFVVINCQCLLSYEWGSWALPDTQRNFY